MSLFLLLNIFNIQARIPKEAPTTYEGYVIDIASNYYTVSIKGQKILLYTDSFLTYGDQIKFKGHYEALFTPPSKSSFSLQKHMLKKNIKYRIKDKNPVVLKSKFSLKRVIHKQIQNHPDVQYLAKRILNINNYELDTTLSSFLLSSKVIIRSLVYTLLSVLNKFLEEKKIGIIEFVIYMFLLVVTKNYPFYLYLIIRTLLRKTSLKALDKLSLSSLLILLMLPNTVFSLSFIVTTLFGLVQYLKISKFKFMSAYVILIPVQLLLFYKCNLFEIFLYPYYKLINCVGYLLAYIDLLLTTTLSHQFTKVMLFKPINITVSGHMPLLLLGFWIIVSLRLLQGFKIRYVFLLSMILFCNQHQLNFNPFLIYTQLYIGQGDCAILKYPFKNEVLILDTGSAFNWSKLESHLNYYGVKTIDSLLITHPDEDHSGNVENLKANYQVKSMIEEAGDYSFYKLNLHVNQYEGDNDNDESLITYFKINALTYLTLGDVSKSIETQFLKEHEGLVYNVVKLAHHGSDTSTSDTLLTHPNINLLINSSGYKNMYKHPHPFVLKRVMKHQLPYIDTQAYGDLEIKHLFQYDFVSLAK